MFAPSVAFPSVFNRLSRSCSAIHCSVSPSSGGRTGSGVAPIAVNSAVVGTQSGPIVFVDHGLVNRFLIRGVFKGGVFWTDFGLVISNKGSTFCCATSVARSCALMRACSGVSVSNGFPGETRFPRPASGDLVLCGREGFETGVD